MASTALRQTASYSALYEHTIVTRPKPPLPTGVVPASRLEARPANVLARTVVPAIDAMAGGLPRGALSEIYGPASSGRSSLILSGIVLLVLGLIGLYYMWPEIQREVKMLRM